jgi:membrane protein implicated in regulation of membrane protease activity
VINQFPAFFIGWIVCGLLLVIFHFLWSDTHRIVRYLLGGAALCVGCSVAGLILNDARITFGPWGIASSGLIIALLTWNEARTEAGKKNAQKNGQLIGIAKGMAQDLGGQDAQSGLDEKSRRN